MGEVERIKELQKMKKAELIDLVLKLETGVIQLKNDINRLEEENKTITMQKDKYKTDVEKYKDNIKPKKHNERGAGRKSKFTKEQVKQIEIERAKGKSIRAIAEEFGCSVGLVHKLISKSNNWYNDDIDTLRRRIELRGKTIEEFGFIEDGGTYQEYLKMKERLEKLEAEAKKVSVEDQEK